MAMSSFPENPSLLDQAERTLMGSDSAVSTSFLEAIDMVQSLIDSMSLEAHDHRNQCTLNDSHSVMQLAMYRMEEEFRNLLEQNSGSVDPEWLFDPVANPSFGSISEGNSSHFAPPSEDYGEGEEEERINRWIRELGEVVPGGHGMREDAPLLLQEAAHYISSLQLQVQALHSLTFSI